MDMSNAQSQIVVRTFMPDINTLKSTAKRMNAVPGTALNLYANAGEVLVVITAAARTPAAAEELCEGAARRFETELGYACYGRGKESMAQLLCEDMLDENKLVASADSITGEWIGEQFNSAREAEAVYDFGEDSYNHPTVAPKLAKKVYIAQRGANVADAAAGMATAAQKCAKTDYGIAFSGLDSGHGVCVAVAAKHCVYVARVAAGQDEGKQAAMMALDIIRRDLFRLPQGEARMFAKNRPIQWNKPMRGRSRVPLLVTLLVLLAVVCGLWFVSDKLTRFTPEPPAVPAVTDTQPDAADGAPTDGAASDIAGDTASDTADDAAAV